VTEAEAGAETGAGAGAALSYGWNKFRAHSGALLLVVIVPILAELVVAAAGKVLIDSAARRFLFQILGIVIAAVGGLGVRRMALLITAGETPTAAEAFRYDRWIPWIAFSVVFGVIESIGLVLCVIPGVVFLAYCGLAPYFFIDQQMSIGDALRASREAVVRDGLAFPVLFSLIVGVLGVLVFVVGVVVTEAVAALALAFIYRRATGAPVAA
jgi:hypothetical protein